jgi:hypothetical protein
MLPMHCVLRALSGTNVLQPTLLQQDGRFGTRAIACGIRRESYSNRLATTLSGADLDNPATVRGRTSGTVVVPRITGPIRRLRPVEVHDVEFLHANTERMIKITLPGPFTMSRQAKNEFYRDEEELVMDYAAVVNAEVRDLKAAGADVIQLDEPWPARRGAPSCVAGHRPRTRRHPRADRTASLLRLCLCRPRQAERLCVPAGALGLEGRADLDRSRPPISIFRPSTASATRP